MSDLQSARMRLEQSSSFQRSGALLLLLDFLLEAAAEGPVKETSVGVSFYKREATYDPRYDSIARVNVRRLRQRLVQFYATEGAAETCVITIPVGSFTPLLQTRATDSAASVATEAVPGEDATASVIAPEKQTQSLPVDTVPPARGTAHAMVLSRPVLRWFILAGLAFVSCLVIFLASAQRHRTVAFPEGPWRTVPLTSGRDLEFEPATTRDGKRLAYVTHAPGTLHFQIFLRNLISDTPAGALLDTGAGDAFYPAWSPDASQIAFLDCGAGPCQIAIVPARGGSVRHVRELPLYTLPDDQAYYQFRQVGPVWTGDGRSLIYPYQGQGDNAERLVQHDLATGTSRQLTFGEPGDDDGAPAISHDGSSVAFLRRHLNNTDIMTLNLKTGVARVLETEPSHTPSGVTWAPDDSGVVVGILRRASGAGLLWVPLEGAPRALDVILPGLLNPVFTGDGKAIMVLSSNRNRNIARIAGDDPSPQLVFHSKQRNSFSSLSADTHRLAFLSSLSGDFELWISERQGKTFSTPRQLTHGLPFYPVSVAWAPDGQTLAVGISHTNRVEMVDAKTGAFQTLQVPGLEHSDVWSPAWSADGRSIFLAVQGERKGIARASTTLISGVQPVMKGDAQELRLDGDRALYFTTGNSRGIHKLSLASGTQPELVPALAEVAPARDWFIEGARLYYLDLHDASRRVHSYDLVTGQIELVTPPLLRPAFLDGSLTYAPKDHLLLYSQWSEEAGSQIFLLYPSGKPLNED